MDSPEGKEARKDFHETVRSLGNKLDSETVLSIIRVDNDWIFSLI